MSVPLAMGPLGRGARPWGGMEVKGGGVEDGNEESYNWGQKRRREGL